MHTVSRLIETFAPKHYELSMTLLRGERKFSGIVTLKGTSPEGAKHIVLHAKNLAITSVTFDGKEATFATTNDDELEINHPDIAGGDHIITVDFSGNISDSMEGLYPCYFEHDGVKKELLATQFESHYAREVFPCIDEPEAKATFDVTLTTEQDVTVLGNMPVKSQRTENNMLVTSFETTPRMSSYLLAWVVGELQKVSATTKSGVEVNIWSTPAHPKSSLDFALEIATKSIDYYDEYFGTPYPLVKSDHVALPDFSVGAMENWGLITYREVALLAEPGHTSLSDQHYIATVIAHELSHQWFGNLVTMKWWNDLWLNESFASMMEYLAVDAIHPEWEMWLEHDSNEVLHALRRDSLDGVQSIRTDVSHPDEISSLFDPSIVYAKGGRLLRMLQTYIGNAAFQKGLALYFKKFAYQNTQADDLWSCMSQASGQDIGTFMNTWISQPGFPVVHVTEENGKIFLSQERFFIGDHEPSDQIWPIPLNATSSTFPKILSEKELTIDTDVAALRLNAGNTAHFITHYSPELLTKLVSTIETLPTTDRMQLLHEQTLLAQAGLISTAELIPLLSHYKNEDNDAVWTIMAVALNEIKRFVETDEEAEKKLRLFVGELASAQYERLGWEAKPHETEADTKFRGLIISQMLYSEQKEVVDKAIELYNGSPVEKLDPEIRAGLMTANVRQAKDQKIIDHLIAVYKRISNGQLQEDIASALTSTKEAAVVDRLIGLFKDQGLIRLQDFPRWYVWLMRNRYGRDKVWDWTVENWDWLVEKFKGGMHYDSIPRYVASSLVTEKQLAHFTEFFTPLTKEPALKRNIELGIAELKGRVKLIERDGDAVRKALLDL